MTLYEQIGGEPAVRAAVEPFYAREVADRLLAPCFADADMARLKAHQFAFLSQALGGPQRYAGASMSRAHSRLRIEQRHFDAVATHLAETLRGLEVSESLVAAVGEAVTSLAGQIVNTGAASA